MIHSYLRRLFIVKKFENEYSLSARMYYRRIMNEALFVPWRTSRKILQAKKEWLRKGKKKKKKKKKRKKNKDKEIKAKRKQGWTVQEE